MDYNKGWTPGQLAYAIGYRDDKPFLELCNFVKRHRNGWVRWRNVRSGREWSTSGFQAERKTVQGAHEAARTELIFLIHLMAVEGQWDLVRSAINRLENLALWKHSHMKKV